MTNAYDAWKAAQQALAVGDLSEGLESALQLSVAALREPAKQEAVRRLVRQYSHFSDEELAREIVRTLEEFEQTAPALADLRRNLATATQDALDLLAGKNWTGDNTYGEAIEDMQQVLGAVFTGRDFPKLDRFRCPSRCEVRVLSSDAAETIQCKYELPHDQPHHSGGHEWTDEQSVNPPKSYDEPGAHQYALVCGAPGYQLTCSLLKGHEGSHAHNGITWDLTVGGRIEGGV